MKFRILIGLFMMLGLSVGVNAQSFLSAEDAVDAIGVAVDNIDSYALNANIPAVNIAENNNGAITVTQDQVRRAYTTFLLELRTSIKTFSDTQAGYDDVVARFSPGANTSYRAAGLDGAKAFALQIIAN